MIQITKCPCGKTFAGCAEPYCYTDTDYQKTTRDYIIKKGCTVEMAERLDSLEKCTCKDMNPCNRSQIEIF